MKKIFLTATILLLVVLILSGRAIVVFAESSDNSKNNVESVFQGAKEALDNLIFTKDSGKLDDVSSRVKAFNQVLDLSIAESKDYAAKLVAIPKNEDYDLWVENSLKILADNISFYNDQKKLISDSSISLDDIKKIASDFKNWRDEKYLPFVKSLQTFFLIEQEGGALDITSKRLANIKKDLNKISLKAKDKKVIDTYIVSSSESIEKAKLLNKEAYNMFLDFYIKKDKEKNSLNKEKLDNDSLTNSTSSTTTLDTNSVIISSTTEKNSENIGNSETEGGKIKENTDSKEEKVLSDESIRVLVKSSLEEIKKAYQNFIDISNYVRKLLK